MRKCSLGEVKYSCNGLLAVWSLATKDRYIELYPAIQMERSRVQCLVCTGICWTSKLLYNATRV